MLQQQISLSIAGVHSPAVPKMHKEASETVGVARSVDGKAGSISAQTGWVRSTPMAICQDFDSLIKVTDYDFDLSIVEFQEYCKQRGTLHKAGSANRFRFTANHQATKEEFFGEFRHAEEQPDGTRYRFTDKELDVHWEIMRAAKGTMQDCWELYKGTETTILGKRVKGKETTMVTKRVSEVTITE